MISSFSHNESTKCISICQSHESYDGKFVGLITQVDQTLALKKTAWQGAQRSWFLGCSLKICHRITMVVVLRHVWFSPRTLGKWFNLIIIVFEMGWFNHQLGISLLFCTRPLKGGPLADRYKWIEWHGAPRVKFPPPQWKFVRAP